MDKLLTVLLALVLLLLIALIFIKIGWSLFMVPVFGMKPLTWMQALGFAFLAVLFRSGGGKS